jgi:dephospho-CoA kinase
VIKVGITGGIGSGKSVVCQIFDILGIPIYYADYRAKYLINTNSIIQNEIASAFGKNSFTAEGYNRKYMAKIVFNNAALLDKLNNIVHPHIAADFKDWYGKQNYAKYVIQEAAILFESGADKILDKIVLVDAPIELRIIRLKNRDSISEEEIKNRMNNQWPSEKLKKMADWVIDNDDKKLILPQVLKIHNQILNLFTTNG